MRIWPNLFIAGAPRCGTSSLHAWLQGIPGIYMSRIKEPNFFSKQVIADDHPRIKPIRDEAAYLSLFSDSGQVPYRGEASPNYLEDPGAASMIREYSPDSRIIVSLRDPVERLFSTYLMLRNNVSGMGSFGVEIERGLAGQANPSASLLKPRTGLYASQIERFRATFGDSQFKVLIFEELMADVPSTLREILAFLEMDSPIKSFSGLPQRQYSEARGPLVRFLFGNRLVSRTSELMIPYELRKWVRNRFLVKQGSKPVIEPQVREFLIGYYRDDVIRVERLLGRRVPWRNFDSAVTPRSAM